MIPFFFFFFFYFSNVETYFRIAYAFGRRTTTLLLDHLQLADLKTLLILKRHWL